VYPSYKLGLTSVVPLRKKIKDSLTRQGMQNIRGFHKKGVEKGSPFLSACRAPGEPAVCSMPGISGGCRTTYLWQRLPHCA